MNKVKAGSLWVMKETAMEAPMVAMLSQVAPNRFTLMVLNGPNAGNRWAESVDMLKVPGFNPALGEIPIEAVRKELAPDVFSIVLLGKENKK
jgi:hypothetical protein